MLVPNPKSCAVVKHEPLCVTLSACTCLLTDFQRNVREPLKRGEITDDGSVEIMPAIEQLTLISRADSVSLTSFCPAM